MKTLLPIGSVVTLKGATKKLMIIGALVQKQDADKIYDYMGIPYPEGYIDSQTMFLFMHDDVESIEFVSFVNAEHQAFRTKVLEELADKAE